MISMMRLRKLPSDENLSLRGDTLREAIQQDKEKGLIPFFVRYHRRYFNIHNTYTRQKRQ